MDDGFVVVAAEVTVEEDFSAALVAGGVLSPAGAGAALGAAEDAGDEGDAGADDDVD